MAGLDNRGASGATGAAARRRERRTPVGAARAARTLWAFSRPHTMVGTSLSVLGIALIAAAPLGTPAWPAAALSPALAMLLGTWLAALATNLYIVGLNQVVDLEVDRLNKPELPLPSGALGMRAARAVVAGAGLVALGLGLALGPWLLATLLVGMAIGTAYSLPPTHWKRAGLAGPIAIATVRGPVVHLGLYAHFRAALGPPPAASDAAAWIGVLCLFMSFFGLAIGLTKDLPDLPGDRALGIGTPAVRRGAGPAFRAALGLLVAAYVASAALGLAWLPPGAAASLLLLHGSALIALLRAARGLRAEDRGAVRRFYRLVWRLFYAEAALLPLLALLSAMRGALSAA